MLIRLQVCVVFQAILCRYHAETKKHLSIPLSKEHNPTNYEERMRIQKAGGTVRWVCAEPFLLNPSEVLASRGLLGRDLYISSSPVHVCDAGDVSAATHAIAFYANHEDPSLQGGSGAGNPGSVEIDRGRSIQEVRRHKRA